MGTPGPCQDKKKGKFLVAFKLTDCQVICDVHEDVPESVQVMLTTE